MVQSLSHINRTAPWFVWKKTETTSLARSQIGYLLHTTVCWFIFTLAQKVHTRDSLVKSEPNSIVVNTPIYSSFSSTITVPRSASRRPLIYPFTHTFID